jgi:hypothetical protein
MSFILGTGSQVRDVSIHFKDKLYSKTVGHSHYDQIWIVYFMLVLQTQATAMH